jgi:2-polyprenyl-6-methoxyphenol hydroxylase-like FAD-dependent oxidoreductase
MARTVETSVLIVGAGPVGLTLALMLGRRGVDVTVVERRGRDEPPPVKSNHVAARSMEIFRRLGVARAVREAGLPADYPNDVAYRTTMLGRPLARIPIPCRRDRYAAIEGPDCWWPTPEPAHRINQIFLEPVLWEHAAATNGVTIRARTAFESLAQDDGGVTVSVRDQDTDEVIRVSARYVVGCDGGRSAVRRAIGARLVGDAVVQRVQSSYIRAPSLLASLADRPAWGNFSLNPRRSGNVYAIDGRETWLVFNYLRPDEVDADAVDRDWAIRTILGVGPDFSYELLSEQDWVGQRLVADRFRERRVFLCGDSAHIWVPYGGYGMNAGIADAENLGWLLASHLAGWGAGGILDAYECERLPITDQVSRFAMDHAEAMARQRGGVPPEIEDGTPAGEAARAALGRETYELNVQQYCAAGLNFGYYYADSPIIADDDEAPPPYTMGSFTASTVPGCRTPHLWLEDGRSLYDAGGDGYALLRFDPTVAVAPLLDAAAARGVPLEVVDLPPGTESELYRHTLLLSRPDWHVAWRGDRLPDDPFVLIDLLRGAGGDGGLAKASAIVARDAGVCR